MKRWTWEEDPRLDLTNCKALISDETYVEIVCLTCELSTILYRSDFDRAETGMLTCAYCQWGIAVLDREVEVDA